MTYFRSENITFKHQFSSKSPLTIFSYKLDPKHSSVAYLENPKTQTLEQHWTKIKQKNEHKKKTNHKLVK